MYEDLKVEWTKDCNCKPEDGNSWAQNYRHFRSDNLAKGYWLSCRRAPDLYYASHGPSGHLLTVHIPNVCDCNDCSPNSHKANPSDGYVRYDQR
jgi:hypothetical protein